MFFKTRQCTRVHRLGVQKTCKIWGKGCIFGHIDKFWKGHGITEKALITDTDKLKNKTKQTNKKKKRLQKHVFIGSIFIPENKRV